MVVLLFEAESQRVCYRPGGHDWPEDVSEPEEDQEEDRQGVQEAEPGGRRLADQLQWGLPCSVPAHRQLPCCQVQYLHIFSIK